MPDDAEAGSLSGGQPDEGKEDAVLERLLGQITWHDSRAVQTQRWHRRLKTCQLVVAALIPVVASTDLPRIVLAALGALVVVVEGYQQLNRFQELWVHHRRTCEELRREVHLFKAKAGIYARASDPIRLLAERSEDVLAAENGDWASLLTQQSAPARQPQ